MPRSEVRGGGVMKKSDAEVGWGMGGRKWEHNSLLGLEPRAALASAHYSLHEGEEAVAVLFWWHRADFMLQERELISSMR